MIRLRGRFTDPALRKLAKEGSIPLELRDQRYPALVLRFKTGRTRASWFSVSGRTWRKAGEWPVVSASEAISLWGSPVDDGKSAGCVLTWYAERLAPAVAGGEKRARSMVSMINAHLMGAFAAQLITGIDRAVVDQRLIQPMRQAGYKPSYIKRALADIKTVFARAKRLDVIAVNPFGEMTWRDFSNTPVKPRGAKLLPHDLPDLLTALASAQPSKRLLLTLMLLHGTRIGETRQTRWNHFDYAGRTWRIPEAITKTTAHALPLTPLAICLLADHRRAMSCEVFVFGSDGEPVSENRASEWARDVSEQAWQSHDLRKLANTCWKELGIDYWVRERLLNHRKTDLDAAYNHGDDSAAMLRALCRWHRALINAGLLLPESADRVQMLRELEALEAAPVAGFRLCA